MKASEFNSEAFFCKNKWCFAKKGLELAKINEILQKKIRVCKNK